MSSNRERVKSYHRKLMVDLARTYNDRADDGVGPGSWKAFKAKVKELLEWADIVAAVELRHRATGERLRIPALEISKIVEANLWLGEHRAMSLKEIDAAAERIARAETRWWDSRGQFLEDPSKAVAFRLGMIYRNGVASAHQTSYQIELGNKDTYRMFPFVRYHSVCKKTSRPSHCAMNGFVAAVSWEGWKIIRPPNGYNCLCTVSFVSFSEARDNRWLDREGNPKFIVKWPNSAAKSNYEKGLFPDIGFEGPKYTYDS